MAKPAPWLSDLARQKLGDGAAVRHDDEGWVAERIDGNGQKTRVTAVTHTTLVWFLNQMPDKKIT